MSFAILPSSCEVFDDYFAEFFTDLTEARDSAFDWSVELSGLPVMVWRLTQGNPIKGMEVVA
jgi:hypothetical protein